MPGAVPLEGGYHWGEYPQSRLPRVLHITESVAAIAPSSLHPRTSPITFGIHILAVKLLFSSSL